MTTPSAVDRAQNLHPLASLPILKRLQPGIARDLLMTVIGIVFTTLLFSLITKLNVPGESLPSLLFNNGVFGCCIGFSIHLFAVLNDHLMRWWFGAWDSTKVMRSDIAAWLLGGVFGYLTASSILGLAVRFWSGLMIVIFWLCYMAVIIMMTQRQRTRRDLELQCERTARSDAERLLTVSHLRMLQAQIEPHFLFNTLANVSTLIDADPKRARMMLDHFTLLLRALLDQTRQSTTTLRKELQVAEAYLSVLKIRMGERLSYRIDAPNDLLDVEMPAMLLQPIVENAVKHGIEPLMAGGVVRVEAKRNADQLLLCVYDNGVGFAPGNRESIGLGAIRERLSVQFADSAQLDIARIKDAQSNDGQGDSWTQVAIRIPMPA